jgi:hypothetical protein
MAEAVFCIARSEAQAITIVERLRAAGFSNKDISVAGAGGVVGGALIGFGIPEYEAKQYEGKLKEGNLLISVHTDDSTERDVSRRSLRRPEPRIFPNTEEARV